MRILIIGGFLGSGKTTLILKIAKYLTDTISQKEIKVAIIENEIGDLSVDDKLFQSKDYNVSTLFSGCICCSLSGEISASVKTIEKDLDPDYIILEATGVAYPKKIMETLEKDNYNNTEIICICDAQRWLRYVNALSNLIPLQLEGAHKIIITKCDLVSSETIEEVQKSIEQYNNNAEYFHSGAENNVDFSVLLN